MLGLVVMSYRNEVDDTFFCFERDYQKEERYDPHKYKREKTRGEDEI